MPRTNEACDHCGMPIIGPAVCADGGEFCSTACCDDSSIWNDEWESEESAFHADELEDERRIFANGGYDDEYEDD